MRRFREVIYQIIWTADFWIRHFRMIKTTFEMVCDEISCTGSTSYPITRSIKVQASRNLIVRCVYIIVMHMISYRMKKKMV